MTWLSERSGMASMGVVTSAQYPQAPSRTNSAITRKRFLSDSSINQLTMSLHRRLVAPGSAQAVPSQREIVERTDYELSGEGERSRRRILNASDSGRSRLEDYRRDTDWIDHHCDTRGEADRRRRQAAGRVAHPGAAVEGHPDRAHGCPEDDEGTDQQPTPSRHRRKHSMQHLGVRTAGPPPAKQERYPRRKR